MKGHRFIQYLVGHLLLILVSGAIRDDSGSTGGINDQPNSADDCVCFRASLTQIKPDESDPAIWCYLYSFERLYDFDHCYFGIRSLVLSICDTNDIGDLYTIYNSITSFSPKYDMIYDPVSLSMDYDPVNNITGLSITMFIARHTQFRLCLNGIYIDNITNVGNKVEVERGFESTVCPNHDGLPCIDSPTRAPSQSPTKAPSIGPTGSVPHFPLLIDWSTSFHTLSALIVSI